MQRQLTQPTFTDAAVAELGGTKTHAFLNQCQTLIPWNELVAAITHLFPDQPKGGRPFEPAIVMIKCTMLAKWFNLSDPQLEEQLKDRISFRQFVGLSFNDKTPDETTFVVFRKRLRESGSASILFDKVQSILTQRGVIVKEGSLIDATIIEAPKGRRIKDETDALNNPASDPASDPALDTRHNTRDTRDPVATHTRKRGTCYFGYKAHIVTDVRGTITNYVFDTASPHDSNHFDRLVGDETIAIYGDSAYRSQKREHELKARGVKSMICEKRVRGQKQLTDAQRRHNAVCAKVRAKVEHAFAWMKRTGWRKVRYRGLRRNGLDFALMAVSYNLRHALHMLRQAKTFTSNIGPPASA